MSSASHSVMSSTRPIFVVTHPRSCSTAFERVFLTRSDLSCAHEPFGDAFYYGPERLGHRFTDDAESRRRSGFDNVTYKDVLDRFTVDGGKRVFIKDMAYYLMPPHGKPAAIAPSVAAEAGPADAHNPTVLPLAVLRRFHFAFLIRHPRYAIPSYYRCTIPPLVDTTLFHDFLACEAGYAELRRLFEYLMDQNIVGSKETPLLLIDADDLLDDPELVIGSVCDNVGLEFNRDMLSWNDPASQQTASEAFEKWAGFHNDALSSTGLKARANRQKQLTEEEEDAQWKEAYGEKGQQLIRKCVNANIADYEFLKRYALRV